MNILSRIRGEYIAESHQTLPDVYTANDDVVQSVFEVPGIGKVRFTHRRRKYRHHKSTSWFWSTEEAVLVKATEQR